MSRPSKPISLILAEGNRGGLSKARILERQESEIKLGDSKLTKLKVPSYVRNDDIAYKHWQYCIKEYKAASAQGVDLITTSDVDILSMYCKTYAEYERLLKSYQTMEQITLDSTDLNQYIDDSKQFDYAIKQKLRSLVTTDALLKIETAINRKMDMIIKISDRLLLNPLTKVKHIPKKKKEEKRQSKFGKFGNNQ